MPSQTIAVDSFFVNAVGKRIFYRNWRTAVRPLAIVIIVHDLYSHSGYYHHFASLLNRYGYDVYASDQQGHGHSQGQRAYLDDYRQCISDLSCMRDIACARHPAIPLFLFGHGFGAILASLYSIRYVDKLDGLICESCLLDLNFSFSGLIMIKFLDQLFPGLSIIKFSYRVISRDEIIRHRMKTDALLGSGKQPNRTLVTLLLAAKTLRNQLHKMNVPVLIIHGTGDRLAKVSGSTGLMTEVSSADKELNLYEGHYHDLVNDKYNVIILKDIIGWLDKKIWKRNQIN